MSIAWNYEMKRILNDRQLKGEISGNSELQFGKDLDPDNFICIPSCLNCCP